jgi:sugar lactone lactonase YvrE
MTLDGRIAVLEGSGCRVQIFEKSGIFLSKFGTYGNDAGKLLYPHGIDTDSSGNFYVGQHYSDRITVFSPAGSYIRVFGSEGTGNGQFDNPFGLAIASNKVYVADNYNNRIAIFTLNGSWIKNFGSHGKKEFSYLSALAKDEEDNYYLVDSGSREIRKLNKHFDFLLRFGSAGTGNGQFSDYSAAAASSGGKLYVTDTNNHRVQIFDKNGNFLGKFGAQGTGNGQFQSPQGICVAQNGNVYVADTGNYRIQVFDKEGQFLLKFGKYGSFDGYFSRPDSIAISPNGEIAVSDNGRTQIFTPNGEWVRKMNISGTLSYGNDGLIYLGSSGVFSGVGEYLKNWWGFGSPAIETAEGDILANYSGTSARIWKRTYRTVHSEPSNALPLPSILSQKRRPGTSLVDVEYTVKDADNSTVQTAALAFKNGGNSLTDVIPITSFAEGTANKLGTTIATGQTHKFTWDVSRDWSTDFGEVQLEILAKDGRGLLNLDFIQIPATGNLTALKISRSPLNDNDFLSAWYWLLGTGSDSVRLDNGEIFSNAAKLDYDGSYGVPGLVANYYNGNTSFSGNTTTQIDLDANISSTPSTGNMSVRWTGTLLPQETGSHRIYLKADHSAKLFINNSQLLSVTSNGTAPRESSTWVSLTAGTPVALKVEYTDNGGSRLFEMSWELPSGVRRTLTSPYLFTGVQSQPGSIPLNARLAYGTTTTPQGRKFIFESMGLREATAAEVTRAKEAGTPGVINQWEPKLKVGPDERPSKINAYGFDTGASGYWVVPVTGNN